MELKVQKRPPIAHFAQNLPINQPVLPINMAIWLYFSPFKPHLQANVSQKSPSIAQICKLKRF